MTSFRLASVLFAILLTIPVLAQPPGPAQVFVGVVSESMCGINHTSMGISPDPKCIVECVKHGQGVKYILVDEKTKAMYTLSDQQTPQKYAAARVKVTGVLYPKTKILKVEKMEAVK